MTRSVRGLRRSALGIRPPPADRRGRVGVVDPYTYPGTDVLINFSGTTDRALWKDEETLAVGTRHAQLIRTPIQGGFDLPHLQAIHRHLTQDMYVWAGQLRTTNTGPGGTGIAHCRPEFIHAEADRIFTTLTRQDLLRGRDEDAFAQGLAWVWGETTVLHPFRDVNTRSQFVFFNQLSEQAGWVIDWNLIDAHVFAHARTMAIVRDEKGIDALLRPALVSAADLGRREELRERMEQTHTEFFRPRPARDRGALDAELEKALRRREAQLGDPNPIRRDGPTSSGPSLSL